MEEINPSQGFDDKLAGCWTGRHLRGGVAAASRNLLGLRKFSACRQVELAPRLRYIDRTRSPVDAFWLFVRMTTEFWVKTGSRVQSFENSAVNAVV